MNPHPGFGHRTGSEVHDDLVTDEQFAAVVLADKGNNRCSILFNLVVPGGD